MSSETFSATGRSKTAIASITMTNGSGQINVNGRTYEEYFPTVTLQNQLLEPLEVTGEIKSYDIEARATGGGVNGQMGAVRHGIARALLKVNPEFRPELKKAGLLKRDPRAKERKKPGQPGARKRFQFSKR